MVPCDCCGEKFYSPHEHALHGGPFTCCKRKLEIANRKIRELENVISESISKGR